MKNILGNEAGWPWLLGLTVIPGILQVITPFPSLWYEVISSVELNKMLSWMIIKCNWGLIIKCGMWFNFRAEILRWLKGFYRNLAFVLTKPLALIFNYNWEQIGNNCKNAILIGISFDIFFRSSFCPFVRNHQNSCFWIGTIRNAPLQLWLGSADELMCMKRWMRWGWNKRAWSWFPRSLWSKWWRTALFGSLWSLLSWWCWPSNSPESTPWVVLPVKSLKCL